MRALFLLITVAGVLAQFSALADGPNDKLEAALRDLLYGSNFAALEESSAKLLHDYSNSPETCGRIYMSLLGNSRYVEGHASNEITASQKALQCPLDVIDQCNAYGFLGIGLSMQSQGASLKQATVLRKEALAAYLNGIKFVLSKAKTLERQRLPRITLETPGFTVPSGSKLEDTPAYKEWVQRNIDVRKVRDEANAANRLIDQYEQFKGGVVYLYSGVPYIDEITEVGDKVLPNAPVLKELGEEVKKANAPPPATNSSTNPGR